MSRTTSHWLILKRAIHEVAFVKRWRPDRRRQDLRRRDL